MMHAFTGAAYTARAFSLALLVGWLSSATPAHAETLEVQCLRMSPVERSELQARARLLLSSAGLPSIFISVDCDAESAWLIWRDGTRTALATRGSLVEAALDAIEARLSSGDARSNAPPSETPPAAPPQRAVTVALPLPAIPSADPAQAAELPSDNSEAASSHSANLLSGPIEGGVSLATVTEIWSGTMGFGPTLDVGVALGHQWAVVVAEGARFATANGGSAGMLFDLQSGIAYGAPYASRTGLGAIALIGAERLASGGAGGLWMWSFTGSLGLRASLASGPVDLWVGADVMLRSATIESPNDRIPPITGLFTLGCLMPAFGSHVTVHARTTGSPALGL